MEEETEKKSSDLSTDEGSANSDKQDAPKDSKTENSADVFKKPLILIGGRNKKGLQTRILDPNIKKKDDSILSNEKSQPSTGDTDDEPNISACEEVKVPVAAPPPVVKVGRKEPRSSARSDVSKSDVYKEPAWSGIATDSYSFEVLKEGVYLKPINLSGASYFIFGRHTSCDNQLIHPTISRFHLVMQYCPEDTKNRSKGFYVYDLGSTHGTFLNKSRIKPQMYVRMQVGHQLRLGSSSRIFIMTGPEDEMEPESELTVTELKAEREKKLLEREMAEKERIRLEEEKKKRLEEEGIDWGMGEDADEEADLTENPYAATNNEELYINDPKKSLRGWFEREGYELEYDVQEKGPGQFLCRVEIPLDDGGRTAAEALVKGKKKEAVVQCALEACRILDRQGLLRQANHESRKRKAKNWEADDYYDSDDDTFLDRTGLVEKKRQQRMAAAGRVQEKAETYDSLMKKHKEVLKQISEVERKLKHAADGLSRLDSGAQEDEEDALDSFMETLKKSGAADKTAVSKLKAELTNLNKEESQLRRLVNIAKPANMPPLLSPSNAAKPASQPGSKVPIVGPLKKMNAQKIKIASFGVLDKKVRSDVAEEVEEDEEEDEQPISEKLEKDDSVDEKSISDIPNKSKRPLDQKVIGPTRPQFLSPKIKEEESAEEETIDDEEEGEAPKESKKRRRNRVRPHKKDKNFPENCDSDPSDPKYSSWVPPVGQTGDGRTALNDKLGY